MKDSLDNGKHAVFMEYVTETVRVMEKYLPAIKRLMARREQIGQQLYQNDYTEPNLYVFSEKELIFDYDYMSDLKMSANEAMDYGDEAARMIEHLAMEAESVGRGYVSVEDVLDTVYDGKRKLHRVENYLYEFEILEREMQEFESQMSDELMRIMNKCGESFIALLSNKKTQNIGITSVSYVKTSSVKANIGELAKYIFNSNIKENMCESIFDGLEKVGDRIRNSSIMKMWYDKCLTGELDDVFDMFDFEMEEGIYHVNVNKYNSEYMNELIFYDSGFLGTVLAWSLEKTGERENFNKVLS